jgi:hypothetical protein
VSPKGDEGFEEFWQAYPRRNGKRAHKQQAATCWRRLSNPEKGLVMRAVANYHEACEEGLQMSAADAYRWLRDRDWEEEWQTPAVADALREPERLQGTDRAKPGAVAFLAKNGNGK